MRKHLITLPALVVMAMSTLDVDAAWINDPAPAFELVSLEGKDAGFPTTPPKVTFINFWASWCPPCKDEFPRINRLAAEFAGKDVRVVAITVDKALANVNRFLEASGESPVSVEILRDPSGKAAKAYAARAMPMSFIVGRNGVIRFAHMGFQTGDEARWREEINALLAESK